VEIKQHYDVGENGIPIKLTTASIIRALEPLEQIIYVFDTNELRIKGLHGCTAGPVVQDAYEPDKYWAVSLALHTPLDTGDITQLIYQTLYNYTSPPPNELVQNGAARGVENVHLTIQFHANKLPSSVWWELRDHEGTLCQSGPLKVVLLDRENPQQGSYATHKARMLLPHHLLMVRWEW
jgi:hypothetical protein